MSAIQSITLPFYTCQTANSFSYACANLYPFPSNRSTYYPVGIIGTPNYAKTALQYWPYNSFTPTRDPYRGPLSRLI